MTLALEVRNLVKKFGGLTATNDLSFDLAKGESLGLIGPNGAGKTTFVNMVTGYLKPSGGRIEFMGKSVVGLPPRDVTKLGLCRSFQVPQVFLSESIFDNMLVAYGIAERSGLGLFAPLHTDERAAKVDAQLKRYQIAEYRDMAASALPQGIRKLLDIAMATVRNPKLVMLDEPTSGISVEEKFGLMDIIMQALREEETTVMFIEHDMEIVERFVDRVWAFYQGQIICDATTAEAMKDEKVREFVIGQEYHPAHVEGGAHA